MRRGDEGRCRFTHNNPLGESSGSVSPPGRGAGSTTRRGDRAACPCALGARIGDPVADHVLFFGFGHALVIAGLLRVLRACRRPLIFPRQIALSIETLNEFWV